MPCDCFANSGTYFFPCEIISIYFLPVVSVLKLFQNDRKQKLAAAWICIKLKELKNWMNHGWSTAVSV